MNSRTKSILTFNFFVISRLDSLFVQQKCCVFNGGRIRRIKVCYLYLTVVVLYYAVIKTYGEYVPDCAHCFLTSGKALRYNDETE